jgi:hypothetical protein
MSKTKPTPMTREAANRIVAATVPKHGGQIPAKSFVSRVDAALQRVAAKQAVKPS